MQGVANNVIIYRRNQIIDCNHTTFWQSNFCCNTIECVFSDIIKKTIHVVSVSECQVIKYIEKTY